MSEAGPGTGTGRSSDDSGAVEPSWPAPKRTPSPSKRSAARAPGSRPVGPCTEAALVKTGEKRGSSASCVTCAVTAVLPCDSAEGGSDCCRLGLAAFVARSSCACAADALSASASWSSSASTAAGDSSDANNFLSSASAAEAAGKAVSGGASGSGPVPLAALPGGGTGAGAFCRDSVASNTFLQCPQRTHPSEIRSWSGTTLNKVAHDGQRVIWLIGGNCRSAVPAQRRVLRHPWHQRVAVMRIQPSSLSATLKDR